jgi:hypothetical protein
MRTPQQQLGLNFHDPAPLTDPPSSDIKPVTRDKAAKNYTLIRSKRRSLSLSIQRGELVVRAPTRAPLYWINEFVAEKSSWIDQQISIQQQQLRDVYRIKHGSIITLTGSQLTINVRSISTQPANKRPLLREVGSALIIEFSANHRASHCSVTAEHWSTKLFFDWIKNKAIAYMSEKTKLLATQMGQDKLLGKIGYRRTRSKWGHCTSNGDIQYNPLIMLAPTHVVDYIIAHEVCHLQHRNHSKRYWRLVEKTCPDYKHAEQWLSDYGHQLAVEAPRLPPSQ